MCAETDFLLTAFLTILSWFGPSAAVPVTHSKNFFQLSFQDLLERLRVHRMRNTPHHTMHSPVLWNRSVSSLYIGITMDGSIRSANSYIIRRNLNPSDIKSLGPHITMEYRMCGTSFSFFKELLLYYIWGTGEGGINDRFSMGRFDSLHSFVYHRGNISRTCLISNCLYSPFLLRLQETRLQWILTLEVAERSVSLI